MSLPSLGSAMTNMMSAAATTPERMQVADTVIVKSHFPLLLTFTTLFAKLFSSKGGAHARIKLISDRMPNTIKVAGEPTFGVYPSRTEGSLLSLTRQLISQAQRGIIFCL